MSITRKRLIEASTIAGELNKIETAECFLTLPPLQKWGQLTSNQHSYATALLGRYEGESLERSAQNRREQRLSGTTKTRSSLIFSILSVFSMWQITVLVTIT